MEVLGVPPPAVPHAAPSSAAPAASLVDRALARAPICRWSRASLFVPSQIRW
jgi:hypothetical protein